MSSPVLITYLALDSGYDPVFTPAQSLTNLQAVVQAILTDLKLFLGEWWEDLSIGTPVFQVILGQLGTARGQAAMNLALQRRIEGVPYVTGVSNVSFSFVDGQFGFTATANTVFGPVTVTNQTPGASAGLGF
jgi:hypothetical protein